MSEYIDPNSGRASQPGGVALPVLSLARDEEQEQAAADPVMDVGVLVETIEEPEPAPAPKKRGRPRKVVDLDLEPEPEPEPDEPVEG